MLQNHEARRILSHQLLAVGPLLLLALLGLHSQYSYVERSRGEFSIGGSGLVEIPLASSSGLISELENDAQKYKNKIIVSDTPNGVLAKLESLSLRGNTMIFPCKDFFEGIFGSSLVKAAVELYAKHGIDLLDPRTAAYAELLRDKRRGAYSREIFAFTSETVPGTNGFRQVNQESRLLPADPRVVVFRSTPLQSLLNRRSFLGEVTAHNIGPQPLQEVRNHLVFVMSDLGKPYGYADADNGSLFDLEPDIAYPNRSFAGIGRYSVMEILSPTDTVRLTLNLTTTYQADGANRLPPALIEGREKSYLPLIGRGSARVFSEPVPARLLDGRYYIGLDLGVAGSYFPEKHSGAMNWFGTGIRSDKRRLVGFARDVSLVSEKEFATLSPPESINRFPADLANSDLEYSGIYEDGWISERSFFSLRQLRDSAAIHIKGSIPLVSEPRYRSTLQVVEDGTEIVRKDLGLGDFEITAPVSSHPGNHKIELRFSRYQRLTAPDNRPAAALISSIGFTASTEGNSPTRK